MLARLQLPGIRDQLDSLLDEAARANLSARETLILLCEREIARKDHRRIEMALKLAHFPAVKELAGFDFEAQPSIAATWPRHVGLPTARTYCCSAHPSLLHNAHLSISLEFQFFL
jgi:DNA replication protein DnaC